MEDISMETPEVGGKQRKFVRVTGCRGTNFIEFEFAVGTPELFVELILPEPAFAEFCRHNEVEIQPAGTGDGAADGIAWRLRDVQERIAGSTTT